MSGLGITYSTVGDQGPRYQPDEESRDTRLQQCAATGGGREQASFIKLGGLPGKPVAWALAAEETSVLSFPAPPYTFFSGPLGK